MILSVIVGCENPYLVVLLYMPKHNNQLNKHNADRLNVEQVLCIKAVLWDPEIYSVLENSDFFLGFICCCKVFVGFITIKEWASHHFWKELSLEMILKLYLVSSAYLKFAFKHLCALDKEWIKVIIQVCFVMSLKI